MAVKIRLARKGRKKKAFYHIVVADSRAPRDGRFIEKLGTYNPLTNPATIEIDFDGTLNWLLKGAQPTDTCRAILSYKGIMLKKHLIEGVKKGAFGEEEAEKRFQAWITEKEAKIESKVAGLEKSQEELKTQRLEAEKKINEARAAELLKKRSELAAEAAAATKAKDEHALEESSEVASEEPVAEEAAAVEEPVAEEAAAVEEPVAEEAAAVEEPVAEEAAAVEEVVAEEAAAVEEVVAEEAAAVEEPVAEEAAPVEEEEKAETEEPESKE